MRISISSPIPDLGSKPGPGRPGWPSGGAGVFEFKMEIQGPATLSFNASKNAGGTNFSIDWGDTTVVSGLTGTSHSHTYGAGTFTLAVNSKDDTGPIDTFQLTGTGANRNALKKVLNWGTTPWVNLNSAFINCQGLLSVDKSDFYSDVAVNLTSAFENCDNLTTVDFTGWKATGLTSLSSWFKDCTSLTSFLMKGNINLNPSTANHNSLFENSGAATGCSFNMDNINFSTTTGSQQTKQWFYNSNIKIDSKLTNWTFPAANWNLEDYFFDANVIGDNATLDISNWTLPNNSSTVIREMFRNFSVNGTGTEQVVNMTNWNFGSIASLQGFLQGTGIRRVTGLSTWIANGLTNISNILNSAVNFSIDANDNFSSSFWNNSNISLASTMFFNMGSLTDASSAGAFPNLSGATFTNANFWTQSFFSCHFNTNASFSGVNFNGGDYKFLECFKLAEFFNSNSTIDFSSSTVSFSNVESAFRQCKVNNIVFGDNVDFSNCTSFRFSFRSTGDSTVTFPMPTVTFPINSNRPNYSSATSTDSYPAIDFTTCQADNLVRALHDTGGTASGSATTFNLKDSQVTGAPSVVNSYLDNVLPGRGWTMTTNSTDAALPFSYPSYAFDPSSTTSVTPNLIPSGAVFSTTTSGVTVNATTGVATWPSTFTGNINIKCTYTDGCYNEVVILVQVPFIMRTKIPAGGSNFTLSPQMSSGECFIDWGDANSETLTGSTTHSYATSGSDQEYDIKLFDSPSGSKFTGFASVFGNTEAYYEKTILKWGDIEWQNNQWFGTATTSIYRIRIAAPNGADHKPNLSQVTSLYKMFGTSNNNTDIGSGFFEDTNDNLEHWDVSTITNMSYMFRNPDPISTKVSGAENILKCSNWDVSNVTNFNNFMSGYSGFVRGSWGTQTNIDMTNWDTSGATDMSYMFWFHGKNKPGVENFRTENVINLSHFYGGGTWNAKTKMYNSILRWDVSNVENFSSASITVGNNETDFNANFPNNWKFSTDATKNLNFTQFCGAHYMRNGAGPYFLTDLQAFATKTINETFYGGTSYTAWNMDNASSISNFGGSSPRGLPPISLFRNYNIADWNITSKCTSFNNLWVANRGGPSGSSLPFDQDLSGWNVTGITGDQGYFMKGGLEGGYPPTLDVNMSTSNYDATLTAWGALAASVNSGVTVNFGDTKYTSGGAAETGRTALVNAGWTIIDGGGVYSNTNALSFNGSSEYLTAGNFSLNNSAFSIQAYIKSSNTTDFQMIVGKTIGGSNPSNEQIQLRTEQNQNIKVILFGSTDTITLESTGDSVLDGDWHSIAVTWSTSEGAKIYIDGTSRGTDTKNIGTLNSSTEDFLIGARNTVSPTKFFNGTMDELMIWNTVISTGDIQAYANVIGSGSIPDPNSITGLQMWNRMGD